MNLWNKEFISFESKLSIWSKLKNYTEDEDEISLHDLKTQFFLNVKEEEQRFRENTLKSFSKEIKSQIKNIEKDRKQQFFNIKEKIDNEWIQTRYRFNEIKDLIQNISSVIEDKVHESISKLKIDTDSKIDTLQQKLDALDTTNQKLSSENNDNLIDFKSSLKKIKDKFNDFKVNQNSSHQSIELKLSHKIASIQADFRSQISISNSKISNLTEDLQKLNKSQDKMTEKLELISKF